MAWRGGVRGNSITMSYILCLSLVLVSLAPCAEAQFDSRNSVSVSGEVETAGASTAGLVIVLSWGGELDRRADVRSGGDFDFWDVPSGHYELKVATLHGQVIHSEYVSLNSMTNRISVRLPQEKVERPASGTVSAAKLRHKVPSKARKEFEKGVEAARKNDSAAAIGHLTRATELDPDFMEAHNNLGAQHLKCEGYEPALAAFQKAVELDPGARAPLVNLAATLLTMERSAEAETAARKAIRLDASSGTSRYLLGLALLQQQKNTSEALDNLQRASETVPRARLAIAEVMEKRGDVERAKKELRAYVNSAKPKDRQSVENWLAELQ
jgi:tetratricopeptide (TPR) repeat protein